jgi:hypothetical protein
MNKYLIEIQHGGNKASCIRYLQAYLRPRTHLVKSVEWGCFEGENKAWLIIKAGSREDALGVVPALYRKNARITRLNKFALEGIAGIGTRVNHHTG